MSADTDTLLQLEQRLIEQAQPFAVITVIRAGPPTSTWVGAQALVEGEGVLHGWIGGGCSRAIVIQAALEAIRSGRAKRIRISNEPAMPDADVEVHAMPCASNGTIELFIQPTLPAPFVLVVGSTPTALEACVLAQRMGLRVCAAANVTAPFAALGLAHVIQGFDAKAFGIVTPQLILVATQGDCDEDVAGCEPAQGGEVARRDAPARHLAGAACGVACTRGAPHPRAYAAGDRAWRSRGAGDLAPRTGTGGGRCLHTAYCWRRRGAEGATVRIDGIG
jgi:xanthine/CO dehydrogenase XdhC/CoxF family maturation factor